MIKMAFDINRIKEEAEEDFEEAWIDSRDLIDEKGQLFSLEEKGSTHSLFDLIMDIRQVFMKLGFREIIVPTIIEENEVYKQYGPQAPVILDRIFFLASLERPDIGISNEKLERVKEIIPGFDSPKKLKSIFKRYKKSEINSDELPEFLMTELEIEEYQATALLSIFEEFRELKPIPTGLTLRSHTTAGWFPALQKIQDREDLPIQLFTVGPKYRREQRLDKTHLYESWTASLVIMARKMSLEDGRKITREIMSKLGFESVNCRIKKATSKYYAPKTEFEVFVKHPETGEMIEIGNAGFYSPVSLAKYDISNPVFNLGIGLERVLMIKEGAEDIRELIYPYQYEEIELTDEEISQMLEIDEKPETGTGKKITERIEGIARKFKDEPSPCEFEVFKGMMGNSEVEIKIIESEKDTKLIGPAGFNEIYVCEGNVVGVPQEGWEDNEFLKKTRENGVNTEVNYMKAIASLASSKIEEAVEKGKDKVKVRVPIVKSLSDLNLKLGRSARRYITNNKRQIDVRGPVFTTVLAEIN